MRIRNQGHSKRKRDHPHLPHSAPSEVEGVRIVIISFRNIAKKTNESAYERIKTLPNNKERRSKLAVFHFYSFQNGVNTINVKKKISLPLKKINVKKFRKLSQINGYLTTAIARGDTRDHKRKLLPTYEKKFF